MSNCPKCGRRLKVTDISQHCPGCGTNLRFYGFEEQFASDAKKAELSMANVHMKLRTLRGAFLGGIRPKLRIAAAFLPLLSLLVPSGTAVLMLPFAEKNISFSALGLYGMFTDGTLNYIISMGSSEITGELYKALFSAIASVAVTAVLAVLVLLLTIFCFASIKKMSVALSAVSALGIAVSLVSPILINSVIQKIALAPQGLATCSLSFGFLLSAAVFAFNLVLNALIAKKGVNIEFDEGMPERVEIRKKVKKGELNIDDLPQPIVETAETRKIDDEIRKEQLRYEEKT